MDNELIEELSKQADNLALLKRIADLEAALASIVARTHGGGGLLSRQINGIAFAALKGGSNHG